PGAGLRRGAGPASHAGPGAGNLVQLAAGAGNRCPLPGPVRRQWCTGLRGTFTWRGFGTGTGAGSARRCSAACQRPPAGHHEVAGIAARCPALAGKQPRAATIRPGVPRPALRCRTAGTLLQVAAGTAVAGPGRPGVSGIFATPVGTGIAPWLAI